MLHRRRPACFIPFHSNAQPFSSFICSISSLLKSSLMLNASRISAGDLPAQECIQRVRVTQARHGRTLDHVGDGEADQLEQRQAVQVVGRLQGHTREPRGSTRSTPRAHGGETHEHELKQRRLLQLHKVGFPRSNIHRAHVHARHDHRRTEHAVLDHLGQRSRSHVGQRHGGILAHVWVCVRACVARRVRVCSQAAAARSLEPRAPSTMCFTVRHTLRSTLRVSWRDVQAEQGTP
jgi:hypothetical protein